MSKAAAQGATSSRALSSVRSSRPGGSESATRSVLVLHGPNLNLLGVREPEIYGRTTLAEVDRGLIDRGKVAGLDVSAYQSNHEGELVDRIQQAGRERVDFMLVNAGAYTHTSVALRDALSAVDIPFIEVHLSNVFARDRFRHHSYLSDIAVGVVCGLGPGSYRAALDFVISTVLPASTAGA
ncbi:MAG: type II 3-dehydroquinate dehydratase [Proteobacteria bacterium]|nr:type II 3-dehydroquinate dehydratase [Burkholderiales bacterium]